MTLTRLALASPFSTSLSITEAFSTPASTLPEATKATVASCAPEKAMFLKSLSGSIPSLSRKKRGIRCPEVDDGEPKAKVLPFSSESDLTGLSAGTMNLLVNTSSSARWTIGMASPPVRSFACTKVKPPSQARSIFFAARPSTTAA
jgi:hypothetical protein